MDNRDLADKYLKRIETIYLRMLDGVKNNKPLENYVPDIELLLVEVWKDHKVTYDEIDLMLRQIAGETK